MTVNLAAPDPDALHAVAGIELGWAEAGIRKPGRKDLLLLAIAEGASVAGVFTREVAETKIKRVEHLAREQEFPLRLTMEPEEEEDV